MTPEEQVIRDKQEALAKREALTERTEHEKAKTREAAEPELIFDPAARKFVPRRPAPTAESQTTALGCLAIILTPFIGGAVGVWIGSAVAPQPDPNAFLDLTGLDWAVWGGLIGFFASLLLVIIVCWLLLTRPR